MLRAAANFAFAIALSLVSVTAKSAGLDEVYIKPARNISWSDKFKLLFNREDFAKSYAIVIGIGNYKHYDPLAAPAHDAIRIRDFLKDEANFDYIITLTDEKATRNRIESLMEVELPQLIKPKDRFFFYFSGHGDTRTFARDQKRGYLVLQSSGLKNWHEMIDMPRLRQWAQNLGHARHSLLLLDSCFSGLSGVQRMGDVRETTITRLIQPGHHIITAGQEGEESFAIDQQSLFTSGFLDAARYADSTGDGIVSLTEMMPHIYAFLDRKSAELGEKIKMTPHRWFTQSDSSAGEFFFLNPKSQVTSTGSIPNTSSHEYESKGSSSSALSASAKDALERGKAYLKNGDINRAIANFDRAISLDPNYAVAWAHRGEAFRLRSEFDLAIVDFDRAISLDPNYAVAWAHRGEAFRLKGDLDLAIVSFDKAISLDSKYVLALGHRGEAYRAKGEPGRAIVDYSTAINLDPKYGWLWHSRAEAYRIKGEFNRSMAEFDQEMLLDVEVGDQARRD